ncbi:uncharacterized protein KY384_002615 [Bacidia gigantensis]|uniref:uncharacterized protein n=1 Tax=Bacidia gigantensis TaxID=2732470 RepID=UPI001D055C51|nr:uncharacterized protein KY384_002615 [Bacidia gigantensis]KAG8532738.1 hypothetical protein KY384_002615 [Bacidia gigantensis]
MAAQMVQLVTVVDKSGKAVNSSKHMVNVWKEAKAAYKERKAEVVATRYGLPSPKSPRSIHTLQQEEHMSRTSSSKHSRSHHRSRHHSHEDRRRSSHTAKTAPSSPTSHASSRRRSLEEQRQSAPTMPSIQRSFTDHGGGLQLARAPPRMPPRSYTTPSSPTIDMDLAYGELPGPVLSTRNADEQEMQGLVSTVRRLLEEADCLHHSATKTIGMLQKNPDAMAAVALALAEISNIATKMAPTTLANISRSAPSVFGLLASPQFLIAGGVAVGLTVVAFGGYKIIKKLKAQQAIEAPGVDEMIDIGKDMGSIETWRRGIADEQAASLATSVDGEYITAQAAALAKLSLEDPKNSTPASNKDKKTHGSSKSRGERPSRSASRANSKTSLSTTKSKSTSLTTGSKDANEKKAKKPSPLRLMFH